MKIDWDREYDQGKDFTPFSTQQINRILGYAELSSHDTYLDLGCGTGQLTREFFHQGFEDIIGVDGSSSALELARRATTQSIRYIQKDLNKDFTSNLPKENTLISCVNTLAFLNDKATFIKRTKSLLAKDGAFVLITPYPPLYKHKKNITVDSEAVTELLRPHYNLIVQYTETNNVEVFICRPH